MPTVWDGAAAGGVGETQPRLPVESLARAFDDGHTMSVAASLVLVAAVAGDAHRYVRGHAVAPSLLAHLGYGITLGAVFDPYVGRDGTPITRPQV